MSENMRQFLLALNAYEAEWYKLADMIEPEYGASVPDIRMQYSCIEAQKTVLKQAACRLEEKE